MSQSFLKDPTAELDYSIDWSDWLVLDTIASSAWVATAGITIEASPAPSSTATTATVWLSGGTAGQSYLVTNTIVTAAGRTEQRTITMRVAER